MLYPEERRHQNRRRAKKLYEYVKSLDQEGGIPLDGRKINGFGGEGLWPLCHRFLKTGNDAPGIFLFPCASQLNGLLTIRISGIDDAIIRLGNGVNAPRGTSRQKLLHRYGFSPGRTTTHAERSWAFVERKLEFAKTKRFVKAFLGTTMWQEKK